MSRRLAPAAGSARSFWHSPKPPYGTPATRLRVSSPARTRSTTTFGGVTYDVARQILMGHGRCARIWPQANCGIHPAAFGRGRSWTVEAALMVGDPTPYPELNAVLEELVTRVRA